MVNLVKHQHQGEAENPDADVEGKNPALSFFLRYFFRLLLSGFLFSLFDDRLSLL